MLGNRNAAAGAWPRRYRRLFPFDGLGRHVAKDAHHASIGDLAGSILRVAGTFRRGQRWSEHKLHLATRTADIHSSQAGISADMVTAWTANGYLFLTHNSSPRNQRFVETPRA